jgi:hypothetical protein
MIMESDNGKHGYERTNAHTEAAVAVSFASRTDVTTEPTRVKHVLSSFAGRRPIFRMQGHKTVIRSGWEIILHSFMSPIASIATK